MATTMTRTTSSKTDDDKLDREEQRELVDKADKDKEEDMEDKEDKEKDKEMEMESRRMGLNVRRVANFFRSRSKDRHADGKRDRCRRDPSTVHSEGDLISECGVEDQNGSVANMTSRKTKSVAEEGGKKPSLFSQLKESVISGSSQRVHSSTKEARDDDDEKDEEQKVKEKKKKDDDDDDDEHDDTKKEDEDKEEEDKDKESTGIMANLRQLVPALNLHRKHVRKDDVETGETKELINSSSVEKSTVCKKEEGEESTTKECKEEDKEELSVKRKRTSSCSDRRKCACCSVLLALLILLLLVVGLVVSKQGAVVLRRKGDRVTTHTHCGPVDGVVDGERMYSFLGIRYAAPVARFEYARAAASMGDCVAMEAASVVANNTVCARTWPDTNKENEKDKEDCLTLDIFTPSLDFDDVLPVVVYIPGDDVGREAHQRLQPSSKLAKDRGVVFVSVRYRTSVLGFLSRFSMSGRTYPPASGNYGLSDLVAALQWVNRNIHQFGGHPKRVTLLARGSAATLGLALAAVPQVRPIINRLWLSNGAGLLKADNLKEANLANEVLVEKLGCDGVEDESMCLDDVSSSELMSAVPFGWNSFDAVDLPEKEEELQHSWLTLDKRMLVQQPIDFFIENRYDNEMPIVFGLTRHGAVNGDLHAFMDWEDSDLFEEHVQGKLSTFNESVAKAALDFYNVESMGDNWEKFAAMVTDIRNICPMLESAQSVSNNFVANVYLYLANHKRSSDVGGHLADATIDVDAILHTDEDEDEDDEDKEDGGFNVQMQRLFYAFVYSGVLPREVDLTEGLYVINDRVTTQSTTDYKACQFWNQQGVDSRYGRRF